MSKAQNTAGFSNMKIEEATLDGLYHEVRRIWNRDRRERSLLELWLNVVSKTGAAVESIRREEYGSTIPAIADVAIWVLRFIAQANEPTLAFEQHIGINVLPNDLLWNKFPGVCPACLDYEVASFLPKKGSTDPGRFMAEHESSLHDFLDKRSVEFLEPVACQCLSRPAFAELRHERLSKWTNVLYETRLYYADATRNLRKKITKLGALESMFSRIFGGAYQILSLEQIAFHLLEEVSEVATALADCYTLSPVDGLCDTDAMQLRLMGLEEELADVLSWLFAVELKIRHVLCSSTLELMSGLELQSSIVNLRLNLRKGTALSEIIRSKYARPGGMLLSDLWCPECQKATCKCQISPTVPWANLRNAD